MTAAGQRSPEQVRAWYAAGARALVVIVTLLCDGCLVPLPAPAGRAGRLSAADGAPVPNATVVVDTLDVITPPSDWSGTLRHRFQTQTDAQGRWRVPGRITLRFGIPVPDAMPSQADEYTFTAPDGRTLHRRPGLDPRKSSDDSGETLRAEWDAPPPTSLSVLPAFGVTVNRAQTVAGHLGALILVHRGAAGAGLRLAAEAGRGGAGGAAAILLSPRAGSPVLALEVGARYLRPWSNGASRSWLAPEVGLDLSSLRFTTTILSWGTGGSSRARGVAWGIGWGFF